MKEKMRVILSKGGRSIDTEAVSVHFDMALADAGGDLEKLARGLMSACFSFAERENLLLKLLCDSVAPKKKGRPLKKPLAGLTVPPEFRTKRATIGAPKRNALPNSTKVHAIQGAERLRSGEAKNAREAAIFELLANRVSPTDDQLVGNLQRRISEVIRSSVTEFK
jgi:hypothetical protein